MNLIALFLPLLLLCLLIELPWAPLRTLDREFAGSPGKQHGSSYLGHTVDAEPIGRSMTAAILITVPIFGLLVFCFVPFGQLVGWLLENATAGIRAYSVNVIAGLGGITLFTALCFADTPPVVWLLVFAALLVAGSLEDSATCDGRRWPCRWCVLLFCQFHRSDHSTTYWSPYQKLSVKPIYDAGEIISYEVSTNDFWYQQIVNLSPEFLATASGSV